MGRERRRTRRRFLRTVGVVVGGTGVAGCGSGGTETTEAGSGGRTTATGLTTSNVPERGNEALRQELGLSRPDFDYGSTLRVFQWENYWPPRTISDFTEAYGVEDVTVDTYTSNEVLRATLETEGLDAYDVVFPSDWMVTDLIEAEMLAPLDREKLSNWSNLSDQWVTQAPYDTGAARYSAPYQWGTSGIGWNTEVIDPTGGIDSWDAMWNEAWAGQLTMLDNKRETIGAALKRLGYSLNTRDDSEITEAKEALLQQRDLVKTYDSANMPSNLADGRASPVHTWNGEAYIAYSQLSSQGGDAPIEYTLPKEGSVVWIDTVTVPSKAPNENTAHLFIDYLLNARVNAAISNNTKYATPNEAAREYVDGSLLENDVVFPDEKRLSNLEFIRSVGDASTLYQQAWDEVTGA